MLIQCLFNSLGRVLPTHGNLCYDSVSSRILFTADSATGEASKSDEPLLPYIPYPIDNATGKPIKVILPNLERRADLRYKAPMIDPATGLTVPICGVTIHPTNGTVYPVGMSFNAMCIRVV